MSNSASTTDISRRALLGAPVAAPPPDDSCSDSSESDDDDDDDGDDDDDALAPPPLKKARVADRDDDDDDDDDDDEDEVRASCDEENQSVDHEMGFAYENEDEDEEPDNHIDLTAVSERDDDDDDDDDDENDGSQHTPMRGTSIISNDVVVVNEWENNDDDDADDDDDDASYNDGDGVHSAAFDSADEFRNFIASRKLCGSDPLQLLISLLQQCDRQVPSTDLWNMIDNVTEYMARNMMSVRRKLSHINTFSDVCELLSSCSNIIVLSGAGISVSSGIPDFRSKQGIYTRLRNEFGMPNPESMFDLAYFREKPHAFYSFAHELWPGAHLPSPAHHFIAMLERKGKLLRNYSQNIDNLESKAGITKVYQCHGSFATASCLTCHNQVDGETIGAEILSQRIPYCKLCRCSAKLTPQLERDVTYGVMKPDIVFFGEPLAKDFDEMLRADLPLADAVIVIGSSLKVSPVANVLSLLPANVPLLLINKELVGHPHEFDVQMLGFCDVICTSIASRLGWAFDKNFSSSASTTGIKMPPSSEHQFVEPNCCLFPGFEPLTKATDESEDEENLVRSSRRKLSDWYYSVSSGTSMQQSGSGGHGLLSPQVLPSPHLTEPESGDNFVEFGTPRFAASATPTPTSQTHPSPRPLADS